MRFLRLELDIPEKRLNIINVSWLLPHSLRFFNINTSNTLDKSFEDNTTEVTICLSCIPSTEND